MQGWSGTSRASSCGSGRWSARAAAGRRASNRVTNVQVSAALLAATVAVPAVPAAAQELERGNTGDDVRAVQRALGITADGDFGPEHPPRGAGLPGPQRAGGGRHRRPGDQARARAGRRAGPGRRARRLVERRHHDGHPARARASAPTASTGRSRARRCGTSSATAGWRWTASPARRRSARSASPATPRAPACGLGGWRRRFLRGRRRADQARRGLRARRRGPGVGLLRPDAVGDGAGRRHDPAHELRPVQRRHARRAREHPGRGPRVLRRQRPGRLARRHRDEQRRP